MILLVLLQVLLLSLQLADSGDVRLVGGASDCDGDLQVKHSGRWREVHFTAFMLQTAAGFCQRLDCGSAVSNKRREGSPHFALRLSYSCAQSSAPMTQCVENEMVSSNYHYGITCSDSVRLLHGPGLCSGSLEVKRNQSWSQVCEEDFGLKDAEVVCRELGCGSPSLLQGALYGQGFAPVRQKFQCEGHESALMDCPRSSSIQDNCPSGKAVELSCSEPVRLVGNSGACAGKLELKHKGQWKPVFGEYEPKIVGADVCNALDCGALVSAKLVQSLLDQPVWTLSYDCVKRPSLLRECIYAADVTHGHFLVVECPGKPNYFFLLWLVPAITTIIVAVIVLIVCIRKKSSSNAQGTTRSSQPSNPENVEYDVEEPIYDDIEEHIYQSVSPDTVDQEYIELRPVSSGST